VISLLLASALAVTPIIKPLAVDALLIGSVMYADIATSRAALASCPTCREANMLTKSERGQVVLHAAGFAAVMTAQYEFRKHGRKDIANGVRWGLVIALGAIAINNARHARIGR
jgi:hypothetical protein